MKESLCHLMRCDGISMLPGHTNSKGASIELDIARKLGMTEVHIMPVKRRG